MKTLLDPTTIRPELLAEWQTTCAAMKAAADAFTAANAAYLALAGSPASFAERAKHIERRIAARDHATARYLEWQDARRVFFAACDAIQEDAVRS